MSTRPIRLVAGGVGVAHTPIAHEVVRGGLGTTALRATLFALTLSLLLATRLPLASVGPGQVQLAHILVIVFTAGLVVSKRLVAPPAILVLLYAVGLLASVSQFHRFGISSHLLTYVLWIALVASTRAVLPIVGNLWFNRMLSKSALIYMAAVLVSLAIQRDQVTAFFAGGMSEGWRPDVWTFAGGGPNLEITWLALFAPFVRGRRLPWIYHGLTIALGLALLSRAGLVGAILALVWRLFTVQNRRAMKAWLVALAIPVLSATYFAAGQLARIFGTRQAGRGDLSMGLREEIWHRAMDTIPTCPIGCGLGNAMEAVGATTAREFAESNIHNLYLQQLVESGILGALLYIGTLGYFVIRVVRRRELLNGFVVAIGAYFILGAIQFSGSEGPLFLFVGAYLAGADTRQLTPAEGAAVTQSMEPQHA